MKNTIALIISFPLVFFIFIFANPNSVLCSNIRLVPVNPEAASGENLEYTLSGEGLKGLGSVEVTLLYPPGSYEDVHVVFDDALQSDSSTAMANTSSPGSIRIGIIDATGFKNHSGELARISFDAQEDQLQPFRLKGSVIVTDLHGKSKNSHIDIEQPEMGVGETDEEKGDQSDINTSALMTKNGMQSYDNYSQQQESVGTEEGETNEKYKKSPNSKINPISSIKNTIPKNKLRPEYSKSYAKKKYSHRKQSPSYGRKRPSKDEPLSYKVTKVKEMDNQYIVTVDLPREKLNFVLFNGEIIKLTQMNKQVRLKIRSEKECLLYLVTHNLIKIALGDKDIPTGVSPLNSFSK